jgi:DNA topoisomerase IB
VTSRGGALRFRFVGKSGVEHDIVVDYELAGPVIDALRRRRAKDDRLLAWKDGRHRHTVTFDDVNDYLGDLFGTDATAKGLWTWHGTVIAAIALAGGDPTTLTKSARKRTIRAAYVEVGDFLGNTAAIAKLSYVDPRLVDLFEDGTTIEAAIRRAPKDPERRRLHIKRALRRLLTNS